MKIRRFEEKDAKKVSELIIDTLRKTNIKDYSTDSIENHVNNFQPEMFLKELRGHIFMLSKKKAILLDVAQLHHIGINLMKVLYLLFLSRLNIRERE